MQGSPFRRLLNLLFELRVRLRLSTAAVVALATGVALLAGLTVVFGGLTEDVTQRDGLARSDLAHLRWFASLRSDALVSVSRFLSEIGSAVVLVGIAGLTAVVLWRRGQRLIVAIVPAVALGIAGACAAIGKNLVARRRPPVNLHLVTERNLSFPSGHATDASALYLSLALVVSIYVLRRPLARGACVLAAGALSSAIGASRLILGVHWPTDVLAGLALGGSIALAVTIVASLVARTEPQAREPVDRRLRVRLIRLMMSERRGTALRAA